MCIVHEACHKGLPNMPGYVGMNLFHACPAFLNIECKTCITLPASHFAVFNARPRMNCTYICKHVRKVNVVLQNIFASFFSEMKFPH